MNRRYIRQIKIIGEEGQKKLKNARVAVVGIGGLGSIASYYLAAAGVGYLRLIDFDVVEESNLNRQIIHWTNDIGKPKSESAAMKLLQLNPEIKIDPVNEKIDENNVKNLLKDIDVIVDGQDNLKTRLIINEFAVNNNIPYVYGAVYGMEGCLMTIIPNKSPCLRCLYPGEAKSHESIPVLGPTPGVIGCLEATEAIKIITGIGKLAIGRLILYDGENMCFQEFHISKNPNCSVCGKNKNK